MDRPSGRLDRDGVLAVLAAGEVVILPTDTLPGLHARLDRPQALSVIVDLKGRAPDKPLLVVAADVRDALRLMAPLPESMRSYMERCWPGPFTVVVRAAPGLPVAVVADRGTVAVRVPDLEPLRDLLRQSGPLASTSVNRAGEAAARSRADAVAAFPAIPVWDIALPEGPATASALIDLTGDRPVVLRTGPSAPPRWPVGS